MKVNVEIDCTPLEARQFFGLPDVQPMQTAVMEKLQNQMLDNIQKVSPEALMQSWLHVRSEIRRAISATCSRPWPASAGSRARPTRNDMLA